MPRGRPQIVRQLPFAFVIFKVVSTSEDVALQVAFVLLHIDVMNSAIVVIHCTYSYIITELYKRLTYLLTY